MRMSELSKHSGIPVATIKYYLREGLLHPGELTSATQARYDAGHVERLALIRALLGPAGLSIGAAGRVLGILDNPPGSILDTVHAAHSATTTADDAATGVDAARVLLERLGWTSREDGPELGQLGAALQAAEDAGLELSEDGLTRYAATMHDIAESEVDTVPADDVAAAVRQVVLGTILIEPILLALRRLAQQDVSIRRFGGA